ncbi:MAG: tRNA (adenosine(37)-N6)-dimethylallyltransferase MiaA [Rubricoccaceae bacterium]
MNPFLALTGPTAVGKTDLALEIAERLGADILSVDSRQIYRGLDIGTAKPTAKQRARVPHHFVDERDIASPINAGQFAQEANERIDSILTRGRVPLAVGGSTLYLTALVHGLAELPPVPEDIATSVAEQASTPEGRDALFNELAKADPRAAATLDASKTHRLMRLMGVLRATQRPPSEAWDTAPQPRHPFRAVVLDRPRDVLYQRIEQRVDAMLADGLVEENRRLKEQGVARDSGPMRTIGYQEPQAFLAGELSEARMVELLKRNTRWYAKRQLTWFRRYPDYVWLDAETASADDVLAVLTR